MASAACITIDAVVGVVLVVVAAAAAAASSAVRAASHRGNTSCVE
jgi:hypothetical protein